MGEWCRELVADVCHLFSEVAGEVISSQRRGDRRWRGEEKNVLKSSLRVSEVLLILFWE